jgi:cytochrome o ubiquinol oxidase subunit 2
MTSHSRWLRVTACLAASSPAAFLTGCGAVRHGFLNAAGPVAGGERHLFVIVFIVLLFVAGPVVLLTPLFAWHYRLSNTTGAYRPKWNFSWPLEGLIWIPPSLIVVGLAVILWTDTHRFDPYTPLKGGAPVEVQAVALDWKWLFIYPSDHIATLDELDVPAGRPVHLQLTSGTVMQALLLPRLAGQIYAMAGMSTQLNFAADKPGVYVGENTQYNGKGFQNDRFRIVAMAPDAYAKWADGVRRSGAPFDDAASKGVFARSIPTQPLYFSNPPPGLYQHVVIAAGGRSQPLPQSPR